MSSFDEDMREMRRQVSAEVIYTINSSPKLYQIFTGRSGKEIKRLVYEHAEEHDNEFGPVFQAELDALSVRDWNSVARSI